MNERRRATRLLAGGLVVALGFGAGGAQAQVPANDGWVTDQALLLTPAQEQELEHLMQSYRDGSGHDVALLTVPSLQGQPLEDLALRTARAWKIGGRDLHDGALLLVAKAERKMRIEVGRGLEGVLTDSISGRIIRDVIAPHLRSGDYFAGLRAGIVAMHAAAGGGYAEPQPAPSGSGGIGVLLPLVLMILVFAALTRSRRGRGPVAGGMVPGGMLPYPILGSRPHGSAGMGGFSRGGGFGGFGGGGGFSGGGASGGW